MSNKRRAIKAVFFGLLFGIVVTIILMCLMSVVMLSVGLFPQNIVDYAMIAVFGIGAFFAGFTATKINKGAGLIIGLISGFAMFLVITVISLMKITEPVSVLTALRLGAALILGALGGILGLKERKKINI